jgi:putative colanic acid biosynthesis acetyltransferase WcaF
MSDNFNGKKSYIDTLPKSLKIKRFIWNFIWLVFFRPTPRWTLNKWRIFLLKVFGANIKNGARVLPSCKIWAPWNLSLGEYSVIGDDVDCYCVDKIHIGDRVTISQRSFLCSASHDISSLRLPLITKPIIIENFSWVCSECFISPGSIVKEGSVIAARSVLIKNSTPWDIYAGNPAKVIKKRIIKEEK